MHGKGLLAAVYLLHCGVYCTVSGSRPHTTRLPPSVQFTAWMLRNEDKHTRSSRCLGLKFKACSLNEVRLPGTHTTNNIPSRHTDRWPAQGRIKCPKAVQSPSTRMHIKLQLNISWLPTICHLRRLNPYMHQNRLGQQSADWHVRWVTLCC